MKIYVSEEFHRQHQMLGRDQISNMWFFNLYFQKNARVDQFTFERLNLNNLTGNDFQYAFLAETECDELSPGNRENLQAQYLIQKGEKWPVCFLERIN